MTRNDLFKTVMIIVLVIAALIFFSPLIGISELIYPARIDSTYIKYQKQTYLSQSNADSSSVGKEFLYLPSQLGLRYKEITSISSDSVRIKSWFIYSREPSKNTLIILHDHSESKIRLLSDAKQFTDRGFNVCLPDLRAHGESEGWLFTLGKSEVDDIKVLIDRLQKTSKNISIMGIGIGGNIALSVTAKDDRIRSVIAQSVFDKYDTFIRQFAYNKWGGYYTLLYPIMQRQLKKDLKFNPDTLNILKVSEKLTKPVLFIAGEVDNVISAQQSYNVYIPCPSERKEFWLIDKAGHNIAESAKEEYYNRIAVFLVKSFPKPIRKSRFRRLV